MKHTERGITKNEKNYNPTVQRILTGKRGKKAKNSIGKILRKS